MITCIVHPEGKASCPLNPKLNTVTLVMFACVLILIIIPL